MPRQALLVLWVQGVGVVAVQRVPHLRQIPLVVQGVEAQAQLAPVAPGVPQAHSVASGMGAVEPTVRFQSWEPVWSSSLLRLVSHQ